MNDLVNTLMRRDGLNLKEANDQVSEAQDRMYDGEDPETILLEEFGLEPDFVLDLIDFNR